MGGVNVKGTHMIADLTILDSLGWALLHSLWQGTLAACLVVAFRNMVPTSGPAARYGVQVFALLGCFMAFLITLFIYHSGPPHPAATLSFTLPTDLVLPTAPHVDGASLTTLLAPPTFSADINMLTPLLGSIWAIGFTCLMLRYIIGYGLTQSLRRRGVQPAHANWHARFNVLCANAGLPRPVELLISTRITSPVTLGFWKPVVLVPVGFLTGLPQAHVEAILLHEIAHIRRYDYIINLFQTAIKTVFFFHPAIHFICNRIDEDREQACDDLAVAQGRDPHALAQGLASLRFMTDRSTCDPQFTMAAANDRDTALIIRLKRLTGATPATSRQTEHIILSGFAALLIVSLGMRAVPSDARSMVPLEEANLAMDIRENADIQTEMDRIEAEAEANHARQTAPEGGMLENDRERVRLEAFREDLVENLIEDGLIADALESFTLSHPNYRSHLNDTLLPAPYSGKYCRLLSKHGISKSPRLRVSVSPEAFNISFDEYGDNEENYNTRMITLGTFTPEKKSHKEQAETRLAPPPRPIQAPVQVHPATHAPKIDVHFQDTHVQDASIQFQAPLRSYDVTSQFGVKRAPFKNTHTGIDLKAPKGADVLSSAAGKVVFAGYDGNWGHKVVIEHADGYQTVYAHLCSSIVAIGQSLTAGQAIGFVGESGLATGPHLHFEIHKGEMRLDPEPLFRLT